jgi:hypothetical protein
MNFEERLGIKVAYTRSYLAEGDYVKALASAQEAGAIQDEIIKATDLAVQLSQRLLIAQKEKRDILKEAQEVIARFINTKPVTPTR